MIGLVVTGHGRFAEGIHTSAQMIAGENEYVRYINLEEGMTPEQLAQANAVKDALLAAIEAENAAMKTDLKGEPPHDENF